MRATIVPNRCQQLADVLWPLVLIAFCVIAPWLVMKSWKEKSGSRSE